MFTKCNSSSRRAFVFDYDSSGVACGTSKVRKEQEDANDKRLVLKYNVNTYHQQPSGIIFHTTHSNNRRIYMNKSIGWIKHKEACRGVIMLMISIYLMR